MSVTKRRRASGDQGFTMIFVGLMLIVMMLFAAFAVDMGSVYAERRHDQGAVDASGTSGAVEFLTVSSNQAQSAVTEVVNKVNTDLGRTVSTAQWQACTDPAPLARTAASLGLTPATSCISFSGGFSQLRVRLPDQTINSVFGKIVGINSFTSNAFVVVNMAPATGGALPFVVTANNNSGTVCLRTDNNGGEEPPNIIPPVNDPYGTGIEADPCNSVNFIRSDGARGTTIPWNYNGCSQVGNTTVVDAIIQGMDHTLGTFNPPVSLAPGQDANSLDTNPNARFDGGGGCTTALPNTMDVDTGFTAQGLRCGLIENTCNAGTAATSGMAGRLNVSGSPATYQGFHINNVPLWNYFVASLPAGAPASCATAKSNATAFYDRRAALIDCLAKWNNNGQLFTDNIADEKRLGFVPKIAELAMCRIQPPPNTGCNGSPPDNVHINFFSPVYMDGIYASENNGAVCDATNPAFIAAPTNKWKIHYPGQTPAMTCASGNSVNRISGILIPCGALPADVCDPSLGAPPQQAGVNKIRIIR